MDILKNKNKILFGLAAILILIGVISVIGIVNDNTLKLKTDEITHEAGQELQLDAMELFDADEKKAAKVTFDISAVDVNTVGEYIATASFKGKTFDIKVNVVDTTAPMVEFASRVIFTNDLENTDFTNVYEGVYEASEYTSKLIRFEHKGNLEEMTENVIKGYTDTIPVPCDAKELKAIGSTDIPTEPGVYRSVLEVADVHGNAVLEEVYVVYDTTGARIEDVEDKVITVAKEDLDKEPTIDKTIYSITDNVDGVISADNIATKLELRDANKHEWLVHVSYTDRAGNESKAEFLVTVKEATAGSSNGGSSNSGSSSSGGSTNSQAGSSNGSQTYDPADANRDGVVTSEEAAANISPSEQAMIDAGYGNVVLLPTGNYGVLMQGPDHTINGKDGGDILIEYLANLGLQAGSVTGGWMNDIYYNYIATNITPIDNSGLQMDGEWEIY